LSQDSLEALMHLFPTWLPDGLTLSAALDGTSLNNFSSYDSIVARSNLNVEVQIAASVSSHHRLGMLGRRVMVGPHPGVLREHAYAKELTWSIGRCFLAATTDDQMDGDDLVELASLVSVDITLQSLTMIAELNPFVWTITRPEPVPFFVMFAGDATQSSTNPATFTLHGDGDAMLTSRPTEITISGITHLARMSVDQHERGVGFSWFNDRNNRLSAYGDGLSEEVVRHIIDSLVEVVRPVCAELSRTTSNLEPDSTDWNLGFIELRDHRQLHLRANVHGSQVFFSGELNGHAFGGRSLTPTHKPVLYVITHHADPMIGYGFTPPDIVSAIATAADGVEVPLTRLAIDRHAKGWLHVLTRYADEPPVEVVRYLNQANEVVHEDR
jgi:hypothetical protein